MHLYGQCLQETAHLQHCRLFISPGNKPEAHGVLWESAVLQGQSQLFTAQRAKARDNFHLSTQPVISVSKNKSKQTKKVHAGLKAYYRPCVP